MFHTANRRRAKNFRQPSRRSASAPPAFERLVDTLAGNQGQDWFFANLAADNGGPIDKVTDKGPAESWLDSDLSPFGLPSLGGV